MGELDGAGCDEGRGVCGVRSPEELSVDVLTLPCRVWCTVKSTRGSVVLADDVPVESGQLELSSGQQTQERLTFNLSPDWTPLNEWSPFAPYGQVVRLLVHVEPQGASPFTVDRGSFLLQEVTWDAGSEGPVKVTAYSLLQRLVDDDFPFPTSPDAKATLKREVERLCYPHLVPVLECDDPVLPGGLSWGNKRVEALGKLADMYGLRFYVGADDALHVVDSTRRGVVATYSGEDLLLTEARKASHAVPNRWTAVSNSTSGDRSHAGGLSHTVEVNAGPRSVALYGVVHKVLQVQAGSQDEIVAAADRAMREATSGGDVRSFRIVQDFRLDLGDLVQVRTPDGETVAGAVTGLVMDLSGGAQSMRVDVREKVV